jgi:hypothetical protein
LGQGGYDSPAWIFRSHEVLLMIYAILVVLGAVALLGLELSASISTNCRNIEMLSRAGLVLAWTLVWLAVALNVFRFIVSLESATAGWLVLIFIVGAATGFAPLMAGGILAVSGVKGTLIGLANDAASAPVKQAPRLDPAPRPPTVPIEQLPATRQAVAQPAAIEERLSKLQAWQREGLISEAEYQRKKQEIFGQL